MSSLPSDATGDALRGLVSHGTDLERPMLVDFHLTAPSEADANAMASAAQRYGFDVKVYQSSSDWTCQGSIETVATYDVITRLERQLDSIARLHGGHADGFGSFGNAQ